MNTDAVINVLNSLGSHVQSVAEITQVQRVGFDCRCLALTRGLTVDGSDPYDHGLIQVYVQGLAGSAVNPE